MGLRFPGETVAEWRAREARFFKAFRAEVDRVMRPVLEEAYAARAGEWAEIFDGERRARGLAMIEGWK